MPGDRSFEVRKGLDPDQRLDASRCFWGAFSEKLDVALGPEDRALRFLERVIDPTHALSAVASDGTLLGVAGFKTPDGAFVGGSMADLRAAYGAVPALWRGLLLTMLERECEPGRLLMDGIFVRDTARGHGVGTALLHAVLDEAARRGLSQVRLDVIDTNRRARALYEKMGFKATSTTRLGPLRHLFGFASATTMLCPVGGR